MGIPMPGTPARFAGIVVMSLRYMASGSLSFSPSLNAVVGAAGDTSTSTCPKAATKSRWINKRTLRISNPRYSAAVVKVRGQVSLRCVVQVPVCLKRVAPVKADAYLLISSS